MFQLSREVRFAINPGQAFAGPVTNGHGGYPTLMGLGRYFALHVTLKGQLDPASQYLRNIKQIDEIVREHAIGVVANAILEATPASRLIAHLSEILKNQWAPASLYSLSLLLTPFQSVSVYARELPMVRLNQRFEFSAAHRLHNPTLSEQENRALFGKCNNPHGHGHNYELQVTLRGEPGSDGLLADIPTLERIVASTVIERFDHKHLNIEVPEFRQLIPTVENIAKVIYTLLEPVLKSNRSQLASVTVWETPKTWCEYSAE